MSNDKLFNQMMVEYIAYKNKVRNAHNDHDFYFFEGICAGIAEVLTAMGYSQKDINRAYLNGKTTTSQSQFDAGSYQDIKGQDYWNGR